MKSIKCFLGISAALMCATSCQPANTYSVGFKTSYIGLEIADKYVAKDADLNTTISIDTSVLTYKVLPNSLTKVTSGGKEAAYTYTVNADKTKADFKMAKAAITGNIVITIDLADAKNLTWTTAPTMSAVEETKVGDTTYYSCEITGIAKNISNKDLSYAQISFSMYNANGDNIGTAWDNCSSLKKGGTWAIEASFALCKQKPVRFETNDFSSY